MKREDFDVILENQSLKSEFAFRQLELSDVFCPTPDDLERENRALHNLLDWLLKYGDCRDRKQMQAQGYQFPPIDPGISPDNDWYRFEQWLQGKPIRRKLKDQLPPDLKLIPSSELTDEELPSVLQCLITVLGEFRFAVEPSDDIPPRLVYEHLLDVLEDKFDIIEEGFWHLDGCTGYCPGCFQRPWCESGTSSCWSEDEEAGRMYLIKSVQRFVSASPASLEILRKLQAEEDERFNEFKKSGADSSPCSDFPDSDFDPEDDLPFCNLTYWSF